MGKKDYTKIETKKIIIDHKEFCEIQEEIQEYKTRQKSKCFSFGKIVISAEKIDNNNKNIIIDLLKKNMKQNFQVAWLLEIKSITNIEKIKKIFREKNIIVVVNEYNYVSILESLKYKIKLTGDITIKLNNKIYNTCPLKKIMDYGQKLGFKRFDINLPLKQSNEISSKIMESIIELLKDYGGKGFIIGGNWKDHIINNLVWKKDKKEHVLKEDFESENLKYLFENLKKYLDFKSNYNVFETRYNKPSKKVNKICWNITNYCNFRCDYCYIDNSLKKSMKTRSLNSYKEVTKELSKLKGNWTINLVGGEVFQIGNFLDLTKALINENFMIATSTNMSASLTNYIRFLDIVGNNLYAIQFSFHPENYELNNFLKKLIKIGNYLKKGKKKIRVALVATKKNIISNYKIANLIESFGFECIFQPHRDNESYSNYNILEKLFFLDFERDFGIGKFSRKGTICSAGHNYFFIANNGNVFRCSANSTERFKGFMGNILDKTFTLYKTPRKCPFNECIDITPHWK
ncbi:MAG: radical SAM/SPASM domain-containing protein [Nanobdellota archaeon]